MIDRKKPMEIDNVVQFTFLSIMIEKHNYIEVAVGPAMQGAQQHS